MYTAQEDPSPSHSPHSSTMVSPPHSPKQSTSTIQLPSQSKFSKAYSHEPSSTFASPLKLHAESSVQPKISSFPPPE